MTKYALIFLLLSCLKVGAQDGNTISGTVTDASAEPLAGVTVHLLNTNLGTATDLDGRFAISNVRGGKYTLQITAVGYASQQRVINTGSGVEAIDFQLEESSTQLDVVVVTAQKSEEDIQKVPFTVNSISSRQAEQYRLWNTRDITAIIPNLYSASPGDNRNVTSIRGITTTSYDPAVATYVDGVNQFGLDTYIAQLFDIERIEVLSGPQGTLYGRNAMAGVINIITKQPGNTTRGFAEVNIGSHGQQRYTAGVRTPLVKDRLFLGVSGVYDRTDGFYTNNYDGSDFDKKHSFIGNYYLKYLVTPRWALTLNVKHNENRNMGAFTLAGTTEEALTYPFSVNQNAVTELIDNIFNSSLVASYAGEKLNFSSQTAYQSNYRYYTNPIDGDFSPLDIVTIINNYGKDWNNVKVFTQEFKVSSPASVNTPLNWTAGTYFYHQDNPVKQATRFGEDAGFYGIPDTNFSQINTTSAQSTGIAFFGQATYSFTDKLDVTAGLRYDYEERKQRVLGEYQHDPDPNPIFETQPDTSATVSFNAVSPRVSVSYEVTELNSVYATYSRGFRAGGLTPLGSDPSQPPLHPFKPEFSSNIEVGSKNVFLDNKLRVNVSLFYVKVDDAQVPTLVLPDAITVTKNAGVMTSSGVDLHISATPIKDFQVEYNFGFNDAKYTTLKVPQDGSEVDLKGKRQIFTPAFTSMTALQYGIGLGKAKLMARAEWMLLGTQYFDLGNTIKQSPYSVINVRAGVAVSNFEIMLWGRNLGDEKYIVYAYDFGATRLGDPYNYGVTLRASF
jgi:iron complex outermembrane receptor protein